MKKICVITATRAEYGLLYPLISKIDKDEELDLQLVVSGTHLSHSYGYTKEEILKDGFHISKELDILGGGTQDGGISKVMGTAIIRFADYLQQHRPKLAIILGDRYEMMAFAIALANEKIPIAHLNGGEITQGALDDMYRHCITKMSTLHFTNCEQHRRRVIQLGEQPERVFNVGDVCLDNIMHEKLMSVQQLEESLCIQLSGKKVVIVTFHPVTMEHNSLEQLEQLLVVLQKLKFLQIVITKSNADEDGEKINRRLEIFAKENGNAVLVDSLGRRRFLSLLNISDMIIGNSSSGIYEAPAYHIPTVNVGNRQKGRLHGDTVIDCAADRTEILDAIHKALSVQFQQQCRESKNIFGDGNASERILYIIKEFLDDESKYSVQKKFFDWQENL